MDRNGYVILILVYKITKYKYNLITTATREQLQLQCKFGAPQVPSTAQKLTKQGYIMVEKGDKEYSDASAAIPSREDIFGSSDVSVKIKPLTSEVSALSNQIVILN